LKTLRGDPGRFFVGAFCAALPDRHVSVGMAQKINFFTVSAPAEEKS
jgi:hypothetical protein